MVILGLKSFCRWASSEGITHSALKKAVKEIEEGLVDADLGAGLFKKRVARVGGGKSGGFPPCSLSREIIEPFLF